MVFVIRLHVIQEAGVVSRALRLRVLSAGENNVGGGSKITNTYTRLNPQPWGGSGVQPHAHTYADDARACVCTQPHTSSHLRVNPLYEHNTRESSGGLEMHCFWGFFFSVPGRDIKAFYEPWPTFKALSAINDALI